MHFMMKYIRATFLWLAGLTLISHSVLPHHHTHEEDIKKHFCIKEHFCEDEEGLSLKLGNYQDHSNQKDGDCIISHDEINIPFNNFVGHFILSSDVHEIIVPDSVVEIFFQENSDLKEGILTDLPPRSPPALFFS